MKNRSGYNDCFPVVDSSADDQCEIDQSDTNGSALVWINDSKQPRGKVFAEV